jgi:3-isopropylmalate dehydrogenase
VNFNIVVTPGDGVGPECINEAIKVLKAVGGKYGHQFNFNNRLVGGAAIDAEGVAVSKATVNLCKKADAVLLGAVGGPKWDDPSAAVRPEQALFALRGGLELFANLRPVTVHRTLVAASPLKPGLLAGVDMLIVRELTGGLYFGARTEATGGPGGRSASDTLPYAEDEITRVVRLAFELARGRRRLVTSVDKANVLATSRLWRRVAEEVAAEFPDVELEHRLVDACAMQLVRRPAGFDVLVTENLFGDILSDEASVLAGSLGMLPSASVGARRTAHGLHGLYEPIHGSAPDIAGRDLANPIGAILSGAMLLRWSLGRVAAAEAIEDAVGRALDDGFRTADLWPVDGVGTAGLTKVGTIEMTQAIVDRIAIRRAAPETVAARAS